MTEKQNLFSLVFLPVFLFFALPLHAAELTEEQEQQLGALWDKANDRVDQQDYQAALKITEEALEKLEQWRANKISRAKFGELEVTLLVCNGNYKAALDKQGYLLSLMEHAYGANASEMIEPAVVLRDLKKINALSLEQQREMSDANRAYEAALAQGNRGKAIIRCRQVAAIENKYLGDQSHWYVNSLSLLASHYDNDIADFTRAEKIYKKARAIKRKLYGRGHINTAISSANLGVLYFKIGDDINAEILLTEAFEIASRQLSKDDPIYLTLMNNMFLLYVRKGDSAKLTRIGLERAKISKTLIEKGQLDAVFLSNLGSCCAEGGRYQIAEKCLKLALNNAVEFGGIENEVAAHCMHNLGMFYGRLGDYSKAQPYLDYVVTLRGNLLGAKHPDTLNSFFGVAQISALRGDYFNAELKGRMVVTEFSSHLESYAVSQSERQQIASACLYDFYYRLYLGLALVRKIDRQISYNIVLRNKGLVTFRQQLMRSFADSPELEPLFAQLQSTAAQLSTAYSSKKQIDPKLREERIDKLIKQKEAIEQQLSRQSQSFRQAVQEVTPQDLQTALPPNSLLIDFVEYSINERDKSDQKTTNKIISRLAAFIIRPEGPIELVDLCDYEDFQRALVTWRENIGRNTGPATELGKLIWEPLAQYVDEAELVLYSPVGELGSVPFAALPGKEPGSYLLEEKQLVMIPQAKLLPSLLEREQAKKPTVLAIGGVDYESVAENETEEPAGLAASRRAVRWKDQALFTPLPETESELEAVGKLYNQQFDLGNLQTLKDDKATEAAVKRLAPQYSHLHFATHGFFAPPEVKSALDNSDNQLQRQLSFDDQPRVTGFHPGLLSGLALAGANDPPEEGEDGIWTAEEVATMNLSKVDLAVLSACETGLGKVAGGEGLLGLQRAFQVSGAGTTVASLWQVDDAATRALMDEFYRNLWEKKLPKIEALRQAQLKMLREYDPQKGTLRGLGGAPQRDGDAKPQRPSPFYWAAWVLSGDWR